MTEKLNKLLTPIAIIIASIILGGFYYASQANKQRFMEEVEQRSREELRFFLKDCIEEAEKDRDKNLDYWLKTSPEGYIVNAPEIWDSFDKDKEDCFKRYPQK